MELVTLPVYPKKKKKGGLANQSRSRSISYGSYRLRNARYEHRECETMTRFLSPRPDGRKLLSALQRLAYEDSLMYGTTCSPDSTLRQFDATIGQGKQPLSRRKDGSVSS